MSSTQASHVSALLDGLASGAVQVVDLTQPLSETTPIIQLPPPFANTPGLSREEISKYDDRGPAWAWYTLTIGEHVGTHIDAPIHWVTGKDGADIGSIPAQTLVGPGLRDRQDGRDRGRRRRLPAHRRRPRGVGGRERARPRRGVGAAAHRLGLARARPGPVPQRRRERAADAGPRRRGLALAGLRARDRRLRDRVRGHRCRLGRRHGPAVPAAQLPAGLGQARPHPAGQPRPAPDRRGA